MSCEASAHDDSFRPQGIRCILLLIKVGGLRFAKGQAGWRWRNAHRRACDDYDSGDGTKGHADRQLPRARHGAFHGLQPTRMFAANGRGLGGED